MAVTVQPFFNIFFIILPSKFSSFNFHFQYFIYFKLFIIYFDLFFYEIIAALNKHSST
jgi:hypothetical protein